MVTEGIYLSSEQTGSLSSVTLRGQKICRNLLEFLFGSNQNSVRGHCPYCPLISFQQRSTEKGSSLYTKPCGIQRKYFQNKYPGLANSIQKHLDHQNSYAVQFKH